MRRRGAAVLALAITGCIPLPYVVPPVRADVGTGIQTDTVAGSTQANTPLFVTAGVFPLGFFSSLSERYFDFGVGGVYSLDAAAQRAGGEVEVDVVPYQLAFTSWRLRCTAGFQGRYLMDLSSGETGWGGAVRISWEWAKFEGPFDYSDHSRDSLVVGVGQGEFGAGLYVEVSTLQLRGAPSYAVVGGVTFRLPALAGVAVVPIWK
jgi:hypothetical protein